MKNTFTINEKYNAAQNISRRALANGHAPLYYKGIIYKGYNSDTDEHMFEYEGEIKYFEDEFINNGKSEDNSIVIG